MKPYDPEGRQGPSKPLPDAVNLVEYVHFTRIKNCANIQAQARGSRRDPIRAQGPPCSARCSPAGSAADSSAVERRLAGLSVIGLYHTPMDWLLYCPCCTRGSSCSSSSDCTSLHPASTGQTLLSGLPTVLSKCPSGVNNKKPSRHRQSSDRGVNAIQIHPFPFRVNLAEACQPTTWYSVSCLRRHSDVAVSAFSEKEKLSRSNRVCKAIWRSACGHAGRQAKVPVRVIDRCIPFDICCGRSPIHAAWWPGRRW